MSADTRQPGRLRRAAGLSLLAIGTLDLLFMIAGIWWWCGYSTTTWMADIGDGTLYTRQLSPSAWERPLLGWACGPNSESLGSGQSRSWTWTWWTWGDRKVQWEQGKAYTIWPVAPLMLICGTVLYLPSRRDARRRRNNQCVRCGYSRAGLPDSAPCPECAAPAAPACRRDSSG